MPDANSVDLLKLKWGPLANTLPTLSNASSGTMYVHVNTTEAAHAASNAGNVRNASLYFDLGGNRYSIISDLAARVRNAITFQHGTTADATVDKTYNGSEVVRITLEDLGGNNASRITTGKLPLSVIPEAAMERIYTVANPTAMNTLITNGGAQNGDLIQVQSESKTYFVVNDGTDGNPIEVQEFVAGTASVADHVRNSFSISIQGGNVVTYNGSAAASFTIPLATNLVAGVVSIGSQTFAGDKTFNDSINVVGESTFTGKINANGGIDIPAGKKLNGTATNADVAGRVQYALSFSGSAHATAPSSYNGSEAVTLGAFKPATSSADGLFGLVPAPTSATYLGFLRANGTWTNLAAGSGIGFNDNTTNGSLTIGHTNSITARTTAWPTQENKTLNAGVSFAVPAVAHDENGHITGMTSYTMTMGAVTQVLTSGDLAATVLGTNIYSGVVWGTF